MVEKIDDKMLDKICGLAKLTLSQEEREKAKKDMENILCYVEKLEELDTSLVEPMIHLGKEKNRFREDIVEEENLKTSILSNAPKQKDGCFQVPKTL